MAKILRCRDIMPGCTFIATGDTSQEVFRCASEHLRLKHKASGMSPEVIAVIHGGIVDDNPARSSRDGARNVVAGNPWRAIRKAHSS